MTISGPPADPAAQNRLGLFLTTAAPRPVGHAPRTGAIPGPLSRTLPDGCDTRAVGRMLPDRPAAGLRGGRPRAPHRPARPRRRGARHRRASDARCGAHRGAPYRPVHRPRPPPGRTPRPAADPARPGPPPYPRPELGRARLARRGRSGGRADPPPRRRRTDSASPRRTAPARADCSSSSPTAWSSPRSAPRPDARTSRSSRSRWSSARRPCAPTRRRTAPRSAPPSPSSI